MARALRSDLLASPRWAKFVEAAHGRGDGFYEEKCPNCEVRYTILLVVMEDTEAAVNLLREHLPRECPEHRPELYVINEDPYRGRIAVQDSN
jgi:hypothetical protein